MRSRKYVFFEDELLDVIVRVRADTILASDLIKFFTNSKKDSVSFQDCGDVSDYLKDVDFLGFAMSFSKRYCGKTTITFSEFIEKKRKGSSQKTNSQIKMSPARMTSSQKTSSTDSSVSSNSDLSSSSIDGQDKDSIKTGKIRDFVLQKIQDSEMFTSVDISNGLKKEGYWIRNREVSKWLRENILDLFQRCGILYKVTPVEVELNSSNMSVQTYANLYHPINDDPTQYNSRDQLPITPQEFEKMHGKRPF